MIQSVLDKPWIAIALLLVLGLLSIGVAIRIRHDKRKARTFAHRTQTDAPD